MFLLFILCQKSHSYITQIKFLSWEGSGGGVYQAHSKPKSSKIACIILTMWESHSMLWMLSILDNIAFWGRGGPFFPVTIYKYPVHDTVHTISNRTGILSLSNGLSKVSTIHCIQPCKYDGLKKHGAGRYANLASLSGFSSKCPWLFWMSLV